MRTEEDDDAGMGMPAPKRVGPEHVPPVVLGPTRYEVVHWGREHGLGQNGGYIAAFDVKSGAQLRTVKVYDVAYEPDLEEDVQDVFIESMTANATGDALNIVDERGREYVVKVEGGAVQGA